MMSSVVKTRWNDGKSCPIYYVMGHFWARNDIPVGTLSPISLYLIRMDARDMAGRALSQLFEHIED